jgi:TonB family protein
VFAGLQSANARGPASLYVSLCVHAVLFAWLLHPPKPVFVSPSSVARGVRDGAATRLYFPNAQIGGIASEQPASKPQLTLKEKRRKAEAAHREELARLAAQASEAEARRGPPAPPAGTPYGSLTEGPAVGEEVRPALPIVASDPVLSPGDLNGAEGDEIVEITIDQAGNIISMTILQSLGASIDAKVLAALQGWRFHPATRDGTPIASKQDVHYHFKARRG